MGSARRVCVRAAVLVGMVSVAASFALPACQFPNYYVLDRGGGEASTGGMAGAPDTPDDGGADSGGSAGSGGMSGSGGSAGSGGVSGGMSGSGGSAGNGGISGSAVVEPGGGAAGMPGALCPAQACQSALPLDWLGPVVLWEGGVGETPPDCPPGYSKPLDRHHGLDIPTNNCKCTCASDGQVCQSDVEIYGDQSCGSPCATPASQQCTAVSSCHGSQGTIQADLPVPSGGACKATLAPVVPAAWQFDTRICQAEPQPDCEDGSQVCVMTPAPPYTSKTCVMQVIQPTRMLPECPAGYPNRNELYATFTDDRKCSACTCSALSGGTCSGSVHLTSTNNCTSVGSDYTMGDGCRQFGLPDYLSHVVVNYALTPGTCSVSTASTRSGTAVTTGSATVVCCQ